MSSEVNDVSADEVEAQLRGYGQWLEQRSDVALGPLDVDVLSDEPDPEIDPPIGTRLLAVAAACTALLALAGIGFGVIGGDEADSVATASAADEQAEVDMPTSDREDPPIVAAPRPDPAATPEEETPPPATEEAPVEEVEEQDSDAAGDAALTEEADEPETFRDEAITPSTATVPDDGTADADNTDLFMSPRNGATIDLNTGQMFEVRPVDGAASYAFEGWQDGEKVLAITVTNPNFLMPSQAIVGGQASSMEAGALMIRVIVTDATGSIVATDEINVSAESGRMLAPGVTARPNPTTGG